VSNLGSVLVLPLLALAGCGGGGSASGSGGTVAPPITPPAWVGALAIGQWHEIPNTALSSVEPPNPPGNPASKVNAWTSFVVDTRTSKVYSVANGGHRDYAGNEVDVLDLERDQPVWSELLPPTPSSDIPPLVDCRPYYLDGRPASRHTYYGVTLNQFDDRIMLFGGVHLCDTGQSSDRISSYNIGANSYNPEGAHPDIIHPFTVPVPAYTLDPSTGDVYVTRSKEIGRWTRASNTFAKLIASGNGAWGIDAMSAFDTSRRRIFILGTSNGDRHLYVPSSGEWSSVPLAGANASDVATAKQGAMIYVPPIDRFLVRLDGAGSMVYQIDPQAFGVTAYPTTGGSSLPATQNGPYNKFLYVPRLGGAVYVPTYSGNAWFLRLH
jgi:hypothetical protein